MKKQDQCPHLNVVRECIFGMPSGDLICKDCRKEFFKDESRDDKRGERDEDSLKTPNLEVE